MANGNNSELWKLVEVLQRTGSGQGCKAVSVTLFFDGQGKLVGRSEIQRIAFYPGNLFEKLANLTETPALDNIIQ